MIYIPAVFVLPAVVYSVVVSSTTETNSGAVVAFAKYCDMKSGSKRIFFNFP